MASTLSNGATQSSRLTLQTGDSGLERVIDHARSGARLTVDEIERLLAVDPEHLDALLSAAGALRDDGLEAAGRPGVITYSKKVFLPITTLCRDRCHYCIFVDTPGKLAIKGKPLYMSPEQILSVARSGAAMGCKEALFTLGDRPEDRWPDARRWLDEHNYTSTLHYVREMAQLVLAETGLLPHLNPGVMSADELEWMRPVAPSMGMMLETTSSRLWQDKGEVHFGSPDKDPVVRLQVIEDAGLAHIPLTTGLLIGIGENIRERAESLAALRDAQARHGHLQEIIIQNFRSKPATAMQNDADLGLIEYVTTVAVARLVMGAEARIQVPPNLSDQTELGLLVRAGIDDWGGVSPLTVDHVNPERPWPQIADLAEQTRVAGFTLRERLTVHPPYIAAADEWIDPTMTPSVLALADPQTLLADEAVKPSPRGASAGSAAQRRLLERPVLEHPVLERPALELRVRTSGLRAALAKAESAPAALSDLEYTRLLGATGDELDALTALASDVRRYTVGEAISYVVNRNVTSSNLVAESDSAGSDGAWPDVAGAAALTLRTLGELVDDAWQLGASEVCVQGVIPRHLPATSYFDIARAVKAAQPAMHLHAFRPADVADGALRMRLSDADFLAALREAGVDSIPGTGVKILDESFRSASASADLPIARWLSIIDEAHRAGFRSSSVMVYGGGESHAARVAHLRTLAELQDRTGGFTEFVPMPALGTVDRSVAMSSDDPAALDEHRALYAVSRLLLHGRINHIQVPWTRLGFERAAVMLQSGADDLGGTLLDGTVLPEAGVEFGNVMTLHDVRAIARSISRTTRQRSTAYGEPRNSPREVVSA